MADQYHMSDFGQALEKCPHCNENQVFIRKHVNFVNIGPIPLFPQHKEAVAFCRSCLNRVDYGSDTKIDMNMDAQLAAIKTPKILYFGVVAIPTLALIIFIISTVS